MVNNLDLLSVASWLGILVIAVQYYVSNFRRPEKERQFENMKQLSPSEIDKLRREFKTKWDLRILPLLGLAVILGLSGIVIKLVN